MTEEESYQYKVLYSSLQGKTLISSCRHSIKVKLDVILELGFLRETFQFELTKAHTCKSFHGHRITRGSF